VIKDADSKSPGIRVGPIIKPGLMITSSNLSDSGRVFKKSQAARSARVLLFSYAPAMVVSDQSYSVYDGLIFSAFCTIIETTLDVMTTLLTLCL